MFKKILKKSGTTFGENIKICSHISEHKDKTGQLLTNLIISDKPVDKIGINDSLPSPTNGLIRLTTNFEDSSYFSIYA